MNVYQRPQYYEIAFSFRDLPKEVDFFEAAIRKFSQVKVRSVFELGAGTCPYLDEWHQRGYRYFGLDASTEMIEFSRRRARTARRSYTLPRRHGALCARFPQVRPRVRSAWLAVRSDQRGVLRAFGQRLQGSESGRLVSARRSCAVQHCNQARGRLDHETGRDQSAGGLPAGVGRSTRTDLRRARDPRRRRPRQDTYA